MRIGLQGLAVYLVVPCAMRVELAHSVRHLVQAFFGPVHTVERGGGQLLVERRLPF